MSLRKKTILAIFLIFSLTMAIGYIYTHTFFINGYLNLENQEIDANIRRIHYTLQNEIEDLGKLTNDWAGWDDTYSFMQNASQEYINSNLVDSTYSESELNFSIFMDNNGNILYKKDFDLENSVEIPFDNSIYSTIKKIISLNPLREVGDFQQGIFAGENSPVLFAARPILTSLDMGPTRGILVFGKFLNGVLLDHIKSSVDSEVHILPYSPEKLQTFTKSVVNPDIWVDNRQPENIYFFSLIKDNAGIPLYIIEQILPRTIYQQGLSSRKEFLNALFIGSLVASIIVLAALELGFLRRFSKLTGNIKDFDAKNHNEFDMVLKGRDEFSVMSTEIQKTLTKLAEAQNELTTHLDFEKLLVGISTNFINLPIEKIDGGINQLLQVIGEFSKADRGYVRLIREGTSDIMDISHEWSALGVSPVIEERQNIRVNLSSWWIGTLKKGNPIIINDVNLMPEKAKAEMDLFVKQSILSLIAIPLIISGEFIGFLGYNSIREKKEWSKQTILLLEVVGAVIANVIDRKIHENRIVFNQNNSFNLNEITKNSIGKSTLNAACREISNRLASLVNSDNSYLILSNGKEDFDVFSTGHKIAITDGKQRILKDLLERSLLGMVQSKDLDIKENPFYKKSLGESFLSLPLITEYANPGMVVFSFKKTHVFSDEEITFCQQSAAQITLTILKTKALEAARQKSSELSALRATIADITSELELQKLLHTLLERAIKLMKADGGDFCMVDEETGGLKVVASINIEKEYVGTQIRYNEGASGKVLATRKTLFIEDYSTWPDRLDIFDTTVLRSTVVLPLIKGERVLGTLGIFHSNPNQHFKPEDLHLLSLFAQHASIAIENAMLFEKVQQMARLDEVTGLYNRRAFKEMGEYETNRATRLKHPISLAMIDLDNFKQVNDQFSHQIGDTVLREIANVCRKSIRNIDVICRYGGDEMMILMPETDSEKAILAMERLRKILESSPITVRENTLYITASFGLASYKENPPSLNELMDQADSSLRSAKKEGKNCVRLFMTSET